MTTLTQLELCNLALAMIGHGGVASLSDGSRVSGLCNALYPRLRDEVLRGHPWNFAMVRADLTANSTAPGWDFAKAYPLPSDFLRLWKVNLTHPLVRYKIEGQSIVTDESSPLQILYIARAAEALWDASVINVMAARLAWALAMPIAQSGALAKQMQDDYRRLLREARSADASEGQPDVIWADVLVEARYAGSADMGQPTSPGGSSTFTFGGSTLG
jgi:hypothetical protein